MTTLKAKALNSASWSFVGLVLGQSIRLLTNLILTRLLLPEDFGLSALVSSLIVGLALFSDIGIGPSIIQNEKGDEPCFLRTAWTLQVIRGFVLFICACLIAYPFALFYESKQLVGLVVVASFSTVIAGFNSTGLYVASKNLNQKGLVLVELSSQVVSILVMIVWAVIHPTVWALVSGSVVGAFVKMVLSHLFLSTISHKFEWDKNAFDELVKFGRWIFLSTILGFFAGHSERLIVGKFVELEILGVFSIALMISKSIGQLIYKMNGQVLFPVYSKIKTISNGELRIKVKKIRMVFMMAGIPFLLVFVIFGPEIIHLLFDSRYYEAGWMLQVLAIGWIVVVVSNIGPIYLAIGDSLTAMKMTAVEAFSLIVSMLIGGFFWGIAGIVAGISFSKVLSYPYKVIINHRLNLWFPKYDFFGFLVGAICAGGGLWLKKLLMS